MGQATAKETIKFNICLANISPTDRASEMLYPVIDYLKKSIASCGYQSIVSLETFCPDSINLMLESFTPETAKLVSKFKFYKKLTIGIVAKELILNSIFSWGKKG